MTLSFIVSAHNEEACLGAALATIAALPYVQRRFARKKGRVVRLEHTVLPVWPVANITITQRQTTR